MQWCQMLFLQMNKGPGDLNQAPKKCFIRPGILQPKVLQHIMRFVIVPAIETREIAEITRMQARDGSVPAIQLTHECLQTVEFFHSVGFTPRSEQPGCYPIACSRENCL